MEISIIILCLILSAFFSGMEIAFISSNKIYLEIEKKQDNILSKILTKLTEKPSKFTSGSPPELLEITGTPKAIASSAAKPKLSVSEGNKNKSEKHKILSISLLFPKKITLS